MRDDSTVGKGAALLDGDDLLRLIVDSATDYAIFTTDPEGAIVSWSAGAAAIFGYPEEEAIGQPSAIIFTPEDRAAGVDGRELETADRDGCAADERWHLRKDGSRVFMNGSVRPLRDEAGGLRGFLKIARDETEQRRSSEQVSESEARFRNMADHAPVMVWTTDPSGYCTYLNPRWYAFTGQTEAEALGLGWIDATHPDDKARAERAFLDANAAQAAFKVEYRLRTADGRYRWAIDAASPRFAADGAFLGYIGSVIDIDERKEAEQAQAESEAFLRLLLDSSGDGFYAVDCAGVTTLCNTSFLRMLGFEREEDAVGRKLHDVIHHSHPDGSHYARDDCPIYRAAQTGASAHVEDEVFFRLDGVAFPVEYWVYPIHRNGVIDGAICYFVDVSERRQAEAALRESEEHYRHTVELNPQVTWTAAPDGQLDRVAQRWSDWTGTSGLGETWGQAIHPDDLQPSVDAWTRSVTTGVPYDIEHRVRLRDGAYHWMRSRARPRHDAEGGIVKWYGATEDIHERRLAEEELRQAASSLERENAERTAILGQLAEGVIVTDAEGRIVFVNAAAERIHGVKALNVAPDDYSETYHLFTEDGRPHPPHELPLARAVRGGEIVTEARWRIRRPDRSEVIAVGSARPVLATDGRQLGAVLTLRDDTARVSAEAALRGLNEGLEAEVAERTAERNRVWDMSQDLFAIAGFDGMLKAINPAWSRLLGYDDETLLARPFSDLIHPDDLDETRRAVERLRMGGLVQNFEDRVRRDNDDYVTIAWTAAAEGGVFYAVGRDVTVEREREAQLRQAQKMEAVGQLTGGVAHDFNNLLQIVVGNLEILQRNLPDDAARLRRSTDNAMLGARRAVTLTQRLLAFSRRQPLEPKPAEMNRLVRGMSELLSRALGETIELETVLAGGLWRVEIDPNQLESAILNLAVNARDAMPDGGKLTIETANTHLDHAYVQQNVEVAPGQYVVICVSDTGAGMSKDASLRAFEPFFTTKDPGKGTGLGLSQVYGFVKQSGGHVKIYSEVGEGTTVKLYLPRYHGALGEEAALEPASAPEGAETVLVVEDDADVRTYTVEVLNELGYRVLEAADGPAALRLLARPDAAVELLFTDVVLPGGLNGEQLALQARELRPGLKVLFTTGYARNAIVHQGRLDPGVQLITKPFTYSDLAAKVRDVLDGDEDGA